ncbi:MAG: hypothetical protein H6Q74_2552 [Firmicutes bacterium]|nr:hypothetical protein [Bacillota bacterium]
MKRGISINHPIVTDKNIIALSFPTTALGVPFKLLELLTSSENCRGVKRLISS